MAMTINPPGLPLPTIQVRFRGLLVFHPENGGQVQVGVHHAALNHEVRVSIESTPPPGSGLPSELTFLPASAGNSDIELEVLDPHPDPRLQGIHQYPGFVDTPDLEFFFSRLLIFRSLPGHGGAVEESLALSSKIILKSGFFFSAENLDIVRAHQTADCHNGEPDRVSFVAAANVYVKDGGKAKLKYASPKPIKEKEFVADGTTYEIEIGNLPPEGMFGETNHFRFYYLALSGVPQPQRFDICPPHHEEHGAIAAKKFITHLHPCIPVG